MLRIASLFALLALIAFVWESGSLKEDVLVQGTIAKVEIEEDDAGRKSLRASIDYAIEGASYSFVVQRPLFTPSQALDIKPGASVPVWIDKESPTDARIVPASARYPATLSLGVMAIAFSLMQVRVARMATLRR